MFRTIRHIIEEYTPLSIFGAIPPVTSRAQSPEGESVMESLLAVLAEKGIDASAMTEDQIRKVAKAVGVDPNDHLPRKVEIIDYTNKRKETNKFVKSSNFVVGRKDDGTAKTVQGLFLRVEAVDQALADLHAARNLLTNDDEE